MIMMIIHTLYITLLTHCSLFLPYMTIHDYDDKHTLYTLAHVSLLHIPYTYTPLVHMLVHIYMYSWFLSHLCFEYDTIATR